MDGCGLGVAALIEEDSLQVFSLLACNAYFRAISTKDVFPTSKGISTVKENPHQSECCVNDAQVGSNWRRNTNDTHTFYRVLPRVT